MAVAMATSLVIKPLLPLASAQPYRKSHFLRPMTCSSFSRLHLFPMASKKSKSQGIFAASEELSYSVLAAFTTSYNEIVVLDTPETRILLLDSSHNIHSILCKEQKWTGSYWDEFASLPAIIPHGPIAILGLLIDIAREYFALSDLENRTQAGGSLSIHVGDAFSPAAKVEGGFAGIIVDLFSDGKILPELQEVTTWLDMEKKLMPHARIMVNCGGAHAEITESGYIKENENISSKGSWVRNSTIKAMCRAFPGKLSWKRMEGKSGENYLALTGPVPDLDAWSAALPHPLDMNAKDWRPCKLAA